jgi:hypothetical protein
MLAPCETCEEVYERYGLKVRLLDGTMAGWVPLIEGLVKDLIALGWNKDLQQCKSKLGGLRFYIGASTDEMVRRITRAEIASYHTCERCGKPGKCTQMEDSLGYTLTRCPACLTIEKR